MSGDEAKESAAALKRELRRIERAIEDRLPADNRVDFSLIRSSWFVNEIMIGCASGAECSIPRYRERIADLRSIRSPHVRRPDGVIVEAAAGDE